MIHTDSIIIYFLPRNCQEGEEIYRRKELPIEMKKDNPSFYIHILSVAAAFALHELAGMTVQILMRDIPGRVEDARLSGLTATGVTALILIPAFGLMYGIMIRNEGRKSRNGYPAAEWFLLIPFGICTALGLNQLMNLLHLTELPGSYETARQVLFSGTRAASIVVLGFLVPMAEELMFRGVIFGHLRQAAGYMPAVIFSAFLFGVYHGNVVQGIYAFLTGLLLAYVCERFQSILAPFFFHSAANIFVYLASDIEILGKGRAVAASCVLGMAGSVLLFVYYNQKKQK